MPGTPTPTPTARTSGGSDYARLKHLVTAAGLMRKQPGVSVAIITVNALLFAGCFAVLALARNPWVVGLDAVALGLVSAQLGFQLHDAGHNQLFHDRWKNRVVGFVTADLLLGMSYSWWVGKHNRHHANPNHVDRDPDITNPAITYTAEQALRRRGPMRLVARYQAFLFFPLLGLLAWSMHVAGVAFLVGPGARGRRLELVALLLHAVLYAGLLVFLLGPWMALLVIAVHKGVGGFYLASVFAPNHKGMLQTDDESGLDFLRAQVLTSRNVRGGWLTDVLFGSLNYQIEHHLFPTMPRGRIRGAHAIVKEFCDREGVAFHETSVLGSYAELLGFLHRVGAPAADPPAPGRAGHRVTQSSPSPGGHPGHPEETVSGRRR